MFWRFMRCVALGGIGYLVGSWLAHLANWLGI